MLFPVFLFYELKQKQPLFQLPILSRAGGLWMRRIPQLIEILRSWAAAFFFHQTYLMDAILITTTTFNDLELLLRWDEDATDNQLQLPIQTGQVAHGREGSHNSLRDSSFVHCNFLLSSNLLVNAYYYHSCL